MSKAIYLMTYRIVETSSTSSHEYIDRYYKYYESIFCTKCKKSTHTFSYDYSNVVKSYCRECSLSIKYEYKNRDFTNLEYYTFYYDVDGHNILLSCNLITKIVALTTTTYSCVDINILGIKNFESRQDVFDKSFLFVKDIADNLHLI